MDHAVLTVRLLEYRLRGADRGEACTPFSLDEVEADVTATCGGTCACRTTPPLADGRELLVHSTTPNTLRTVAATATAHGADARIVGATCVVAVSEPSTLLTALTENLTPTELSEARAVLLTSGRRDASAVEAALGAPTLGTMAARVRHERLRRLFGRPDRFHARFQPIVNLLTGDVIGHEALLRASDDAGDEIGAVELFPPAAAAGWTHVLDRIGRETALRDAAGWLGSDELFINFVPTSIYRPELCLATTMRHAERHGIPMGQLVFEVVETHRVEDVGHLLDIVAYYRDRGTQIALDDVGSGHASFELVVQVRPDVIKIDQGIVQRLPSAASATVIQALVALGADMGARVLAEGIETAEQSRQLVDLGVALGQGWHFGRPERPPVSAMSGDAEVAFRV